MERKSVKIELKYLLYGEAEEIKVGDWTAEYGSRLHDGVAVNMDDKGMFIVTNRVPNLGERISAQFRLVGVNEKIRTEGDVVWINKYSDHYPKGFAIKFSDINIRAKDFREGVERSWQPEKKFNGGSTLNIPD